jgi:RNA 2',3'-cyclic 3'-phosphodiesterase
LQYRWNYSAFQAKHDIMPRLFVALRPPAAIRTQLTGLMGGVSGARWQDDGQLHLTLKFIGEVDNRVADDIAIALSEVRYPVISTALCGVGHFARRGRVESLWAGVSPGPTLAALHQKIDRLLLRCGVQPEKRVFVPHITLARFGRHAEGIDAFLNEQIGLASAVFSVNHFALYESVLGKSGAHYTQCRRYPLVSPVGSASHS